MLAVADAALDFLVLQLGFDAVRLRFVFLAVFLPRHAWAEYYVLAHAGGVEGGAYCVAFF